MQTLLFAPLHYTAEDGNGALFLKPEYRGTDTTPDLIEHAFGVARMAMQNYAPKETLEFLSIPLQMLKIRVGKKRLCGSGTENME